MDDRVETEFQEIRAIIEDRLVGETIHTLARQKPNRIVDANQDGLTVDARVRSRSPARAD